MNAELNSLWRRFFNFNWKFGLFLIIAVCVPRFALVLNANVSANYAYIGLIMTICAIIPFVFLNRHGLKTIGVTKSKKYGWLLIAFACGLLVSYLLYLLGDILYGDSFENWYVYIKKSYNIPIDMTLSDKKILFIAMAGSGMIFSPIGEELFFRGIVHSSIAKSVGDKKASIVDASAFAFTHISHFGLVFINAKWDFFIVPTILWVTNMFLLSLLCFAFRKYSGSIIGSVICHSAFNLGMIYCIFYLL